MTEREILVACAAWAAAFMQEKLLQGKPVPDALREAVEAAELVGPEHRCVLPMSIQEALNSGDGAYRP